MNLDIFLFTFGRFIIQIATAVDIIGKPFLKLTYNKGRKSSCRKLTRERDNTRAS